MKVIPNGYDSEHFKDFDKYKKIKNRFIYCSEPSRGLDVLCQLMPLIRQHISDATLDIYYSEIKDKRIMDLVNKYSYINFRGKIPQDKLAIELMKSDVWFYPNLNSHETFCMSCLEAMAGGCLVVTRDFSGIAETVGNSGILIKGKASEFYNDALKKIIYVLKNQNVKLHYQKKARKRAEIFEWSKVISQWKEFLEFN